MNESSIKLIKDSCCFRMGGSCASCLLKKLFVAWSGLRHSFLSCPGKGAAKFLLLPPGCRMSLCCEFTLEAYPACLVLRSRVNGITILIVHQFAHRGKDS